MGVEVEEWSAISPLFDFDSRLRLINSPRIFTDFGEGLRRDWWREWPCRSGESGEGFVITTDFTDFGEIAVESCRIVEKGMFILKNPVNPV